VGPRASLDGVEVRKLVPVSGTELSAINTNEYESEQEQTRPDTAEHNSNVTLFIADFGLSRWFNVDAGSLYPVDVVCFADVSEISLYVYLITLVISSLKMELVCTSKASNTSYITRYKDPTAESTYTVLAFIDVY
jgi:hypothetical protein